MYRADDRDSIQFDVKGTINLAGELPPIIHSISIDGPEADQLIVRRDKGGDYRIFTVRCRTAGRLGFPGPLSSRLVSTWPPSAIPSSWRGNMLARGSSRQSKGCGMRRR
jgi:hypothetical protein